MSNFERRIRAMVDRLRTALQKRTGSREDLRREAGARAQRAAARLNDFRESERGRRAAGRLHDLRTSDAAKRAESALNDLRASDVGRRAESALTDLRQRDSVKKAEEGARKVMHDLFSGSGTGTGDTSGGDAHAGTVIRS